MAVDFKLQSPLAAAPNEASQPEAGESRLYPTCSNDTQQSPAAFDKNDSRRLHVAGTISFAHIIFGCTR